MGSWWIGYSIVVASFPFFSFLAAVYRKVTILLSRALQNRTPLTCLYWLPSLGGSRGAGWWRRLLLEDALTPALSAQSPPWEPAAAA